MFQVGKTTKLPLRVISPTLLCVDGICNPSPTCLPLQVWQSGIQLVNGMPHKAQKMSIAKKRRRNAVVDFMMLSDGVSQSLSSSHPTHSDVFFQIQMQCNLPHLIIARSSPGDGHVPPPELRAHSPHRLPIGWVSSSQFGCQHMKCISHQIGFTINQVFWHPCECMHPCMQTCSDCTSCTISID